MPNLSPLNLANQFLIAMPGIGDPVFADAVVYLCEHNERGALGLVINRPTDIDLSTLFDKIDLKLESDALGTQTVLFGGPVQVERGFVLHEGGGDEYSSTLKVPGGLQMTTSKDVLEAVAAGCGPARFVMTLGYAGWSAGQLESEIGANGWLTVEADPAIIFEVPVEDRLRAAAELLGIDLAMLSGDAGHA